MILHSECVYDADNHYIDLVINPAQFYIDKPGHHVSFVLEIMESSCDMEEQVTRVYLRRDDLERIIKDLTKLLDG